MTLPRTRLLYPLLALGAAATVLAALPASAQAMRTRPPVSVTFTYDPEASAATNYRNLVIRVRRACTQTGPRSITLMPNEQACIEGMTSLTVAQLDRPDLNAVYAAATERDAGRRQLAGR